MIELAENILSWFILGGIIFVVAGFVVLYIIAFVLKRIFVKPE